MDAIKETRNQLSEHGKEIKREVEEKLTVLWNELPAWQQDNHYIVSGYRPATNSYHKSFASVGYIHNETVNIWSHLIGALLALVGSVLTFKTLGPRYQSATREDVLVFSCYFLGAVGCLGMSATYHTISNHSHEVAVWGNKLDYLGIVTLIWGSFIPVLYYGFQSEPQLMKMYAAMITTLAAGTSIVSIDARFRTPTLRPFRALMFVLMGLSAVFPVLHAQRLYGYPQLRDSIGVDWILLEGFLYILGAAIYAARFPERTKPGAFDIWGSSHQIFHVLVVLAAISHFVGMVKAFDYEHSSRKGISKFMFLKGAQ